MNEKLYRGLRKEYNTALHNSEWVHGYLLSEYSIGEVGSDLSSYWYANVIKKSIGRRTDMLSKADTHVYEGDIISFRYPVRTVETQFIERMDVTIRTRNGIVAFDDNMFVLEEKGLITYPLNLINENWTLDMIEHELNNGSPENFNWEGDLQYLTRIAKVNTPDDLVEYLSGVEIIGNIHQKEIIL